MSLKCFSYRRRAYSKIRLNRSALTLSELSILSPSDCESAACPPAQTYIPSFSPRLAALVPEEEPYCPCNSAAILKPSSILPEVSAIFSTLDSFEKCQNSRLPLWVGGS